MMTHAFLDSETTAETNFMPTAQQLLADIRSGAHRTWSPDTYREMLDHRRIDGLRRIIAANTNAWAVCVRDLLESSIVEDVMIAHAIGRAVVRQHDEVRTVAKAAWNRWRTNPTVYLGLMHDLMECDRWLNAHRNEIVEYIRKNTDDVREALLTYVEDDHALVAAFAHRLDDVLSGDPQTMNTAGKTFVYLLYLGLARGTEPRRLAMAAVHSAMERLSEVDRAIALEVMEELR